MVKFLYCTNSNIFMDRIFIIFSFFVLIFFHNKFVDFIFLQVFVNFAKYQTDNTLQNDPSFMQAANSSRMLSLKTRWRKMKRALPSRKRSKNSTELLRIPSEASGSIGENEDEVALEDVDSFSFPEETVSSFLPFICSFDYFRIYLLYFTFCHLNSHFI